MKFTKMGNSIKNNTKLKNGYRVSKNGVIIEGFEKEAIKSSEYLGESTKILGTYYFLNRKQGSIYVYLP